MLRTEQVGPPYWTDRPVFVVGTGPSLKGFDFGRLRGRGYVLAVKETWRDLPFASMCFGLAHKWVDRSRDDLTRLAMRTPLVLGVQNDELGAPEPIPRAHYLRVHRVDQGFSLDPTVIEHGGNSGFAAVNLAVLKRPRVIVLLGLDFNAGAGDHYRDEDYAHNPPGWNARYLPRWATNFVPTVAQLTALNIRVINGSPQSSLSVYERMTVDRAIEEASK